ncbi:MAG TPA: type VI secretion system tip protein TssI/VgrG, partial [Gemmatimonadaceae bacterium]
MSSPITGFTQDQRLISIRTPLGDDTLLLAGLTGHEAISSPFHFSLELLSTRDKSITFTDLIGKAVTITIRSADGEPRHVNGIVSAFSQAGVDEFFVTYRAEVVPKLALLTQRTNFLIFQNKSVDQVIEAVLKDAGIADYTLKLSGTYAPLDYCVQYHESDFAFVSRLMEEYGIFYYFEHDKTAHTLVLADQASVHQPCPLQSQATYQTTTGGALDEDVVTGWELRQ